MKKSNPSELAIKTPEELIEKIQNLEKNIESISKIKKWGLVWNDKSQDVITNWKNKLPILQEFKKEEIKSKMDSLINILIEGDNYNSLSVLNYTHNKKIDMIYIDPPYNTGGSLLYNNKYIDKRDSYKHSKFLSILYHRLNLAKSLLKKDGVVCCTIDDHELLPVLGIFEKLNAKVLGIVTIVNKPEGRNQEKYFMTGHEYAVFVTWGNPKPRKILPRAEKKQNYDETASDGRKYRWDNFWKRGNISNPRESNRWYPIYVNKKTLEIKAKKIKGAVPVFPIDTKGKDLIWDSIPETFKEKIDNLDPKDPEFRVKPISNPNKDKIQIQRRIYQQYYSKPLSYWIHEDYSPQAYGNKLLQTILKNKKREFDFPKSVHAVFDCLDIFLPENGLVLDFFAGSGTTGHATLNLNNRDTQLNSEFTKKYGKDWHKNADFLQFEGKLYAHFDLQNLTNEQLQRKWLHWRRTSAKRRFILCTNNEIEEEKLKQLQKEGLSEIQIQNHPEGICKKITYPRMKNLSKGYTYQKENWKYNFNMKYYKIDFISATKNDANKKKLSDLSTQMLCVKEDCFENVKTGDNYSVFKNSDEKYLGIIYDDSAIESMINEIKKLNTVKFHLYVFTLDNNAAEEEFEELSNVIEIYPIPSEILNLYENIQLHLN